MISVPAESRSVPALRLLVCGAGLFVVADVTYARLNLSNSYNGPGVPDDLLPHMFDPFVTTKPTGTGLGLALVAKIVGDHGGVIECESQSRRTIFRVLMPKYAGDGRAPSGGA